jgi:hypothetical protein
VATEILAPFKAFCHDALHAPDGEDACIVGRQGIPEDLVVFAPGCWTANVLEPVMVVTS